MFREGKTASNPRFLPETLGSGCIGSSELLLCFRKATDVYTTCSTTPQAGSGQSHEQIIPGSGITDTCGFLSVLPNEVLQTSGVQSFKNV